MFDSGEPGDKGLRGLPGWCSVGIETILAAKITNGNIMYSLHKSLNLLAPLVR